MGQIATTEQKFMGDLEIALIVGDKPLKLKLSFDTEKKEKGKDKTVKSFYYYNEQQTEYKLKELLVAAGKIIIPLANIAKDFEKDPSINEFLEDTSVGLYELYGDASGQFGISFSIGFEKAPFGLDDFLNLTKLEVNLNLARAFVGSTGIIPSNDGIVLKLLPQDKTFKLIENDITNPDDPTKKYKLTYTTSDKEPLAIGPKS